MSVEWDNYIDGTHRLGLFTAQEQALDSLQSCVLESAV